MKRAWNLIWKIALALAVPGIVLGLIGWSLGGPRPVEWRNGFHVATAQSIHIDQPNLDAFTSIDTNVATLDVQVVTGDHYGLKVDCDNTYRDITWSNENGVLALNQVEPPMIGIFWNLDHGQAVITVPADVKLDAIGVQSQTGNLVIGVPADQINGQSATGDVTLNAAAAQADLNSSTGHIQANNPDIHELKIWTTTGNVDVSNSGKIVQVQTTTGNVTISGYGCPEASALEPCSITVTTTTGSASVKRGVDWLDTDYTLNSTTGSINTSGVGAPSTSTTFNSSLNGSAVTMVLLLNVTTSTGNISVTLTSAD